MARLHIPKNARWVLPAIALGVALALLGALQYRSNKQLRDVLQQQMLTQAQTSLMRIRRGLEEVFRPICVGLGATSQMASDEGNLQNYAVAALRVRGAASHPAVISEILVYQDVNLSHPRLFQISEREEKFQTVDWPANLASLRDYLLQLAPALSPVSSLMAQEEAEEGDQIKPASFPWFVDETIPALVHPSRNSKAGVSFLIVQLDPNELAENVLPQLVEREFGSGGKLSYRVALINLNSRQTILYSSDPGFGASSDLVPDVQLNIFGPPFPGPPDRDPNRDLSMAGAVREAQTRDSISRGAPEGKRQDVLRIEPIRYSSAERGWALIALHRTGSVEAAVSSLYRRNLTADFGVLLVLAAMIATMVISVRRAHQLAQMRMDFVASVSHELRTPLTGIVSSAQNIADGLVTNKERAMQYGAAILSQAHQLGELVEEILLFSSTERGRIYNFQWVDISAVINAALAGTASHIPSAGVRVEQHIEPNLPQVWGDFKALTQCLQNLIINAVRYGGEARWIGISTSVAPTARSDHEVVVAVEDKGLGISPEDLKRIFDPFYRSPAVTGEQIHGSGLGLSIVKNIAEAMGGKLTVQSNLGTGSSFKLHLRAEKKIAPGETITQSAATEAVDKR